MFTAAKTTSRKSYNQCASPGSLSKTSVTGRNNTGRLDTLVRQLSQSWVTLVKKASQMPLQVESPANLPMSPSTRKGLSPKFEEDWVASKMRQSRQVAGKLDSNNQ
jgi:hypothetical protein